MPDPELSSVPLREGWGVSPIEQKQATGFSLTLEREKALWGDPQLIGEMINRIWTDPRGDQPTRSEAT